MWKTECKIRGCSKPCYNESHRMTSFWLRDYKRNNCILKLDSQPPLKRQNVQSTVDTGDGDVNNCF